MPKKKMKVVIPDSALKDIPPHERDEVRKLIMKMFSDPEKAIKESRRIEQLPKHVKNCPNCLRPLEKSHISVIPLRDNPEKYETVQFLDCPHCDLCFCQSAMN